jgi:hypothetical protein
MKLAKSEDIMKKSANKVYVFFPFLFALCQFHVSQTKSSLTINFICSCITMCIFVKLILHICPVSYLLTMCLFCDRQLSFHWLDLVGVCVCVYIYIYIYITL